MLTARDTTPSRNARDVSNRINCFVCNECILSYRETHSLNCQFNYIDCIYNICIICNIPTFWNIRVTNNLEPSYLFKQVNKSPQFNYDYLKENICLIISYLRKFGRYCSHDPLETILRRWMRSVHQIADRMMKMYKILAVFFDRMTNYFKNILTDIELSFLC
jgi:hypothetical protein